MSQLGIKAACRVFVNLKKLIPRITGMRPNGAKGTALAAGARQVEAQYLRSLGERRRMQNEPASFQPFNPRQLRFFHVNSGCETWWVICLRFAPAGHSGRETS